MRSGFKTRNDYFLHSTAHHGEQNDLNVINNQGKSLNLLKEHVSFVENQNLHYSNGHAKLKENAAKYFEKLQTHGTIPDC